MPSSLLTLYLDKRILQFLKNRELGSLTPVSKYFSDLIAGILWERQGQLVPLELPKDWHNVELTHLIRSVFSPNPGKGPYKIEPITGGLSHWSKVYKLTVNNESYVLRTMDQRSNQDSAREVQLAEYFGRNKVAPKVHFAKAGKKLLILEFIKDTIPLLQVQMHPDFLKDIAHSLQVIHHGPCLKLTKTTHQAVMEVEAFKKVKQLTKKFSQFKKYALLMNEAEKIALLVDAAHSCHHDLNVNNILFDGKQIKIIDWEFAGQGDPYFDLATILINLRLTPKLRSQFLSFYFGREPTDEEAAKILLFEQYYLIKTAISFLDKITKYEEVLRLDTSLYPPLSAWSPGTMPLDFSTDQGKYCLSIMLQKQVMANMASEPYKSACDLLHLPQQSLTLAS